MQRVCGWLSGLCALHCVSVPLLLALWPELRLALHQFGTPGHHLMQGLLWSQHYEGWILASVLALHALQLWRQRVHGWRGWRGWLPCALGAACLLGASFVMDWRARVVILLLGVWLLRRGLARCCDGTPTPSTAMSADAAISRPD